MTNYERTLGMIDKAKKNAEFYERNNDEHLAKFWNSCVKGLQQRLEKMTIAQAIVRVENDKT